MSRILNTGLDRETLAILISLCECGVNPEALAAVVKELRREAAALKVLAFSYSPGIAALCTHMPACCCRNHLGNDADPVCQHPVVQTFKCCIYRFACNSRRHNSSTRSCYSIFTDPTQGPQATPELTAQNCTSLDAGAELMPCPCPPFLAVFSSDKDPSVRALPP